MVQLLIVSESILFPPNVHIADDEYKTSAKEIREPVLLIAIPVQSPAVFTRLPDVNFTLLSAVPFTSSLPVAVRL